MEKQKFGYCGLNYETCPLFIAKKNDDNELRVKTVKEYSKFYGEFLGGHLVKQEDMNCSGCQSGHDLFIGCMNCPIRKCCREKELATCASCSKYHICKVLNRFNVMPGHQQAKDNLDRMRSIC